MNKDLSRLLRQLEKQGFKVRRTAGSRMIISRDGVDVASVSINVRDCKALINTVSRLTKAGFKK